MNTRSALSRALRGLVSGLVCWLAATGNSGQAWAAADLIPTLTVAVHGTTVEVAVTVCSMMGSSGSFVTGLYFDRALPPGCGDAPDVEINYPNLQGGACLTEVHTRPNAPTGEMTAWVFADSRCLLSEKHESNNVTSQAYAVGPELSVTALQIAAVGGEVSFTVEVENSGVPTDGPFSVGLYLDRASSPRCADPPDVTLAFDPLGLSQRASRSHQQSAVAAGSYSAWALVDQGCAITERDEENNAAAQAYDVGPNLYVYNPTISVVGDHVTYGVEVCAWEASAASGPYTVGLWYDLLAAPSCGAAGADHLWSEPQLARGACQTLSHSRSAAPAGDFTAHFFGDPGCSLAESREGDNRRSRVYEVGAELLPDLHFSRMSATVSGADVVYRADVCNQGVTAAAASVADLFFDLPAAPACGSLADHRWSVGPLSPGLCQSVTSTRTGAPPGAQRAWMLADADCQQTEENEDNNVLSASYTVGQPDLVASTLSASIHGNQVTFNAQVCNEGSAVGGDFSVGIFFNTAAAPLCSQNPGFATVLSGLGAGACVPVVAMQTAAGPGDKTAWLFVDSFCQLAEGEESNNVLSHAYTVGGEQPDLRLTSFTVQPAGDAVELAATLCNNGTRPAPAFALGFYYSRSDEPACGESPDWSSTISALAAGECAERSRKLQGVSGGSYQAWAKADVACQVGESNESNNVSSQTYQVEAQVMDLHVTSLSVSRSGQQLTFLATICNGGTRATPETLTGLYHDRAEMPSSHCNEIPDQQANLAPLDPGQCVNQSWLLAEPRPGAHQAWVVADVACALMEPSETNNLASQSYAGGPTADAGPGDGRAADGDSGPAADAVSGAQDPGEEGCSCRQSSGGSASFGLGLGLLAAVFCWRRRQISRSRLTAAPANAHPPRDTPRC